MAEIKDRSIAVLTKKPVTILGASGVVGSHLLAHLKSLGIKPICPKRDDKSYLKKDLGVVFYCIGLTADYAQKPYETVAAHVSILSQILEHASFDRLVYLSSTRLYDSGNGEGKEGQDLILNPHNPRHSYDLSKALGEWLCVHASQDRAKVARLASVYTDDLSDNNFLHQVIKRAKLESNFQLDTAPQFARDYIHISDVCSALIAIATIGKEAVYNVASGRNLSNVELFQAIKRINHCDIQATQVRENIQASVVDVSLLHKEFGIVPKRVEDHLERLLIAPKIRAKGS